MGAEPTRLRLWASVVGLSVDQLVAWGVLFYAYGVLSAPIAADLGVSRRVVAGAFSVALLVSALVARAVGHALDRRGARPVLIAGVAMALLALAGLAAARGAVSLVIAFAALGIAQALALYEPAFRAVVGWFPGETERSRALLVVTSIGGLASTVLLPVTAALVSAMGWRAAVLVLAALLAAVAVPLRLALPGRVRSAAPNEAEASARATEEPPALVAQALGAAFAVHAFASTATSLCLVWHLVERGATLSTAAVVAGITGASQVPGRLMLAPLRRALPTAVRLPATFVVQAAALVGIAVASGPALAAALFVFGAANGMMTLERASVVVEWFGRERFGARSGDVASVALLARAAAPLLVEVLRGAASYAAVLVAIAIALAGGGAAVRIADRARGAARVT